MKYFFTENFVPTYYTTALQRNEIKNFLASFASCTQKTVEKRIENAVKILKQFNPQPNIIVDSGAFSAWNSGHEVDRDELFTFYKRIKHEFPDAHFINLDVIPGAKGRKPTKKEADEACRLSYENFLWFKEHGIETLPVFHEDDNWDYLYEFMKCTNYIAISPANDSSVKRRMMWLDKVYSILKADYKTHGLAATSKRLLERYPFYSVDSINWKAPFIYGRSASDKHVPQKIVSAMARHEQGKDYMLDNEIRNQEALERHITNLWAARGVKWE